MGPLVSGSLRYSRRDPRVRTGKLLIYNLYRSVYTNF